MERLHVLIHSVFLASNVLEPSVVAIGSFRKDSYWVVVLSPFAYRRLNTSGKNDQAQNTFFSRTVGAPSSNLSQLDSRRNVAIN